MPEGTGGRIGVDILLNMGTHLLMDMFRRKNGGANLPPANSQSTDADSAPHGLTMISSEDEATVLTMLRKTITEAAEQAEVTGKDRATVTNELLGIWDAFTQHCVGTGRPGILVDLRKSLDRTQDREERRAIIAFVFSLLPEKIEKDAAGKLTTTITDQFDSIINLINSANISEAAQIRANLEKFFDTHKEKIQAIWNKFVNPKWLEDNLERWVTFNEKLKTRNKQLAEERRQAHPPQVRNRQEQVEDLAGPIGKFLLGSEESKQAEARRDPNWHKPTPKKPWGIWLFIGLGAIIAIIGLISACLKHLPL